MQYREIRQRNTILFNIQILFYDLRKTIEVIYIHIDREKTSSISFQIQSVTSLSFSAVGIPPCWEDPAAAAAAGKHDRLHFLYNLILPTGCSSRCRARNHFHCVASSPAGDADKTKPPRWIRLGHVNFCEDRFSFLRHSPRGYSIASWGRIQVSLCIGFLPNPKKDTAS